MLKRFVVTPIQITSEVTVAVDQGVQAPAMLALIISGLAFMEGRKWDGISSDIQQQYVNTFETKLEVVDTGNHYGSEPNGVVFHTRIYYGKLLPKMLCVLFSPIDLIPRHPPQDPPCRQLLEK
jgi:hypothetical protein